MLACGQGLISGAERVAKPLGTKNERVSKAKRAHEGPGAKKEILQGWHGIVSRIHRVSPRTQHPDW